MTVLALFELILVNENIYVNINRRGGKKMTNYEKKVMARDILRNHSQDEVYGDFKDVEDGSYDIIVKKVYLSTNTNGKDFIGIKSTIESGEYAGDFIVECIYINDEAWERSVFRMRNILMNFHLPDLREEDFDNNNYLNRLSEITGKHARVTVESLDGGKSYFYEVR